MHSGCPALRIRAGRGINALSALPAVRVKITRRTAVTLCDEVLNGPLARSTCRPPPLMRFANLISGMQDWTTHWLILEHTRRGDAEKASEFRELCAKGRDLSKDSV